MRHRAVALGLVAVVLGVTRPASAQSVGYQCYACSVGGAEITAAGYTAVDGNDVSVFDFTTVDMFLHLNGDNSSFSTDFTGRSADVLSWLNNGGRLMVFDRYVGASDDVPETSWLPWLSFTATRSFIDDIDIEVLGTAGPFGNGLTDATLDGGSSSSHGWATGLPGGSVGVFSNSTASQYVAFYAAVGAGFVFYSTIPMDYYLAGAGSNGDAFRDWFPTSLDAMLAVEGVESTVPEPATMTLLATGLAGMAAARRRKR